MSAVEMVVKLLDHVSRPMKGVREAMQGARSAAVRASSAMARSAREAVPPILQTKNSLEKVDEAADKIKDASDPFRRIREGADRAEDSVGDLAKRLKRLPRRGSDGRFLANPKAAAGTGIGGAGGGFTGSVFGGSLAAGLAQSAMHGIGRAAMSAAAGVARLTAEIGRGTVEAAVFREQAVRGFSVLWDTDGSAVFERIRDRAIGAGMSVTDLASSMRSLAGAGFGEDMATEIFGRLSDMQAIVGTTEEASKRAIVAISQIKAAGRLQGDELNQLAEAGIGRALVYDAIAKKLGKTTAEVMKMQESGKLDSGTAIQGILDAIKGRTGGKAAGEAGREAVNETLGGAMRAIKNLPTVIFDDLGQAASKGIMTGIKPVLQDMRKILLSSSFKRGLDQLGGFMSRVGEVAAAAWPALKAFLGGVVEGFMPSLGPAGESLEELGKTLSSPAFIKSAKEIGQNLGNLAGKALELATKMMPLSAQIGMVLGHLAALEASTTADTFGPLGDRLLDIADALGWANGAMLSLREQSALFDGAIVVLGNTVMTFLNPLRGLAVAMDLVDFAVDMVSAAVQALSGNFIAAYGQVRSTVDQFFGLGPLLDSFSDQLRVIGGHWIQGLIDGIMAALPAALAAMGGVAGSLVNVVRSVTQVKSPSRVFRGIGWNLGEGLAIGIRGTHRTVEKAAKGLATSATFAASEIPGKHQWSVGLPQRTRRYEPKTVEDVGRKQHRRRATAVPSPRVPDWSSRGGRERDRDARDRALEAPVRQRPEINITINGNVSDGALDELEMRLTNVLRGHAL